MFSKTYNNSTTKMGMEIMQVLALYTDGGCNNNTDRKGAYAFVCVEIEVTSIKHTLKHGTLLFGKAGLHNDVSNNIMEMMAVLEGLKTCSQKDVTPKFIVTDSQYVQKGLTDWSNTWRQNGWKNSTGKKVCNIDLWIELLKWWTPNIQVVHVRGHQGVYWNEICDKNATALMKQGSAI